jgi:hypothetical protein
VFHKTSNAADYFFDPATAGTIGRHVENRSVIVEWEYQWAGSELEVKLQGRSEDRNYVVYLVIEEMLPSGAVLHSGLAVPMTGALTFVADRFFEQELEARRTGRPRNVFSGSCEG